MEAPVGGPEPEDTGEAASEATSGTADPGTPARPTDGDAPPGDIPDDDVPGDALLDDDIPGRGAEYPAGGTAPRSPAWRDQSPHIPPDLPDVKPRVSKLAVLALVTGIIPLVPVAVITAIGALAGIRRSGRRGHGMAVSALFLAAAWVIIAGAVGTVGVLTHGFKKPVKITYNEASVFKLRTGECIDTPNGQQVTIVSCTIPHDAEVFGAFSLTGSKWPGTAAVQQASSSGCASLLASYLNPQLAISLAQTYVYPNQLDWGAGTRTVICEVHAASGQLTQSVRAAS